MRMILKYLIILFFLGWMAIFDLRYRKVPNEIIGALLLTCLPLLSREQYLLSRVLVAAGFILISIVIYNRFQNSIGGADIKIIAVMLLILPIFDFIIVYLVSQYLMLAYAAYKHNIHIKVPYFVFLWVAFSATSVLL